MASSGQSMDSLVLEEPKEEYGTTRNTEYLATGKVMNGILGFTKPNFRQI